MAIFLIETYAPRPDEARHADAILRVQSMIETARASGTPLWHIRSFVVPQDEVCLHIFESPSAEAVEEVGKRAQLTFDRITEAVEPIATEMDVTPRPEGERP